MTYNEKELIYFDKDIRLHEERLYRLQIITEKENYWRLRMPPPRVFVSSTCYDLEDVRDSLDSFIRSFGFIPVLSDKGHVPYLPNKNVQESCLDEIPTCQLFILIIAGYLGDTYNVNKSIVNAEYLKAKEEQIPIFAFVKQDVYYDYKHFMANQEKELIEKLTFLSISKKNDAKAIFKFIESVKNDSVNNAIFSFKTSRDIRETLKKQWAGIVYRSLQNERASSQYKTHNVRLSELTIKVERLNKMIESMFLKLKGTDDAKKEIELVDSELTAKKFFEDIFQYYGINGFLKIDHDKIATLLAKKTWLEFLEETNEFYIQTNVSDEAGEKISDFLATLRSNYFIAIGGHMDSNEIKQFKRFEESYKAFASLTTDKKKEILLSYLK